MKPTKHASRVKGGSNQPSGEQLKKSTGVGFDEIGPGPWEHDPEPMSPTVEATPYPVDSLPPRIREAVIEVSNSVQCPAAMAACSAIAILSLFCQGLVDVARDRNLVGPCSLWILILGESGDRKTTCDNRFKRAVRRWEALVLAQSTDRLKQYEAQLQAWQSEIEGCKNMIKQSSKEGKETQEAKKQLMALQRSRPVQPRIPSLLRSGGDTTEFLLQYLKSGWPSVGLMTNEGGILLGGHSMNPETIVRHLAWLDQLWDGQPVQSGTIARGDTFVTWARVTLCVSVQPQIYKDFLSGTGRSARSIGFLSRILLAEPSSLQGTRFYREPKESNGMIEFERRVLELLQMQTALNDDMAMPVKTLQLDSRAKAVWAKFHDDVEVELAPYGELESIRDIASKIADNAARIAAIFHSFEVSPDGEIGEESMRSACEVAQWHLNEAKRFYPSISAPTWEVEARLLEQWLVSARSGRASKSDILQKGPGRLRNAQARDRAIATLVDHKRARIDDSSNPVFVELHPSLL